MKENETDYSPNIVNGGLNKLLDYGKKLGEHVLKYKKTYGALGSIGFISLFPKLGHTETMLNAGYHTPSSLYASMWRLDKNYNVSAGINKNGNDVLGNAALYLHPLAKVGFGVNGTFGGEDNKGYGIKAHYLLKDNVRLNGDFGRTEKTTRLGDRETNKAGVRLQFNVGKNYGVVSYKFIQSIFNSNEYKTHFLRLSEKRRINGDMLKSLGVYANLINQNILDELQVTVGGMAKLRYADINNLLAASYSSQGNQFDLNGVWIGRTGKKRLDKVVEDVEEKKITKDERPADEEELTKLKKAKSDIIGIPMLRVGGTVGDNVKGFDAEGRYNFIKKKGKVRTFAPFLGVGRTSYNGVGSTNLRGGLSVGLKKTNISATIEDNIVNEEDNVQFGVDITHTLW